MDWVWSPWAMVYLLAGLAGIAAAATVFLLRPHALQNRLLALALFVEGLIFTTVWVTWSAGDPGDAYASRIINQVLVWGWTFTYLMFLGTLDTPLARPFSGRMVRRILLASWTLAAMSVVLWPEAYVTGVQRISVVTYDAIWGPLYYLGVIPLFQIVFLYALVIAFFSWRRARKGSLQRVRARSYLLAFGVRDLLLITSAIFLLPSGTALQLDYRSVAVIQIAAEFLFVALLLYGILKAQLFDIDLKLKWTISKSTLVGIFVGVFFISAQIAQAFLTTEYGWAIGGLVAGLLLLAINPLQGFAAHVADTAMPSVQDTDDYKDRRKQEIYRVTLEEMLIDDNVSTKERRALLKLQQTLGLDGNTATRLEAEILDMRQEAR